MANVITDIVRGERLEQSFGLLMTKGFPKNNTRGWLMTTAEKTKLAGVYNFDRFYCEIKDMESLNMYGSEHVGMNDDGFTIDLYIQSHVALDLAALKTASGGTMEVLTLVPTNYIVDNRTLDVQSVVSWVVSFDMVSGLSVLLPETATINGTAYSVVVADEPTFTAGNHYVVVMTYENGKIYVDWKEYSV